MHFANCQSVLHPHAGLTNIAYNLAVMLDSSFSFIPKPHWLLNLLLVVEMDLHPQQTLPRLYSHAFWDMFWGTCQTWRIPFSILENILWFLWGWNKKIQCAERDWVIWFLCITSEIIIASGAILEMESIVQMCLEHRAGASPPRSRICMPESSECRSSLWATW